VNSKNVVIQGLVASVLTVTVTGAGTAQNASAQTSLQSFLGRWDLTLKAPDREYPSWLELLQENGRLSARMVGRWGNARPLPKVDVANGQITFVSPKEEEDSKSDLEFKGELDDGTLKGTLNGPDGKTWRWTGIRAPLLEETSPPKWGKPIHLFNAKDLSGWTMSKPGPPEWTVQNGILVSPGNGPELISGAKFEDFKLHVEFNCGADANSGVYLRGRYEVQIETESQGEPPSHHTGGVYGFLVPSPELPRSPDTWQTFDITLIGRRVTVVQNGKTIIDNQEIPGITGGAVDSNEAAPGPIYLQGSEKGHVQFRSIVITPAKPTS
jgi:hypothetical protein